MYISVYKYKKIIKMHQTVSNYLVTWFMFTFVNNKKCPDEPFRNFSNKDLFSNLRGYHFSNFT